MAVYTKLSPTQFSTLANKLGYSEISAEGVQNGTNDTKYRLTLSNPDQEPLDAMLNIMETPDVHANGTSAERAKNIPLLLEHIGSKYILDTNGNHVNFAVPSPMNFDDGKPYTTMSFPNKSGAEKIEKSIYVVPYIEGGKHEHHDNKPQKVQFAAELGAAHAAWQKAAEGFPHAYELKPSFPIEEWSDVVKSIQQNPKAVKKLATRIMQVDQFNDVPPLHYADLAQDQINRIAYAVEYISSHWKEKTKNMPNKIINGDPFPDNAIKSDNGTIILVDNGEASVSKNVDIAMALNATAMKQNGTLDIPTASAYLQSFNNVSPISNEEKETLSFMGQVSAVRWALSRTSLITSAPENAVVKTRLPGPLLKQFDFWNNAEKKGQQVADLLLNEKQSNRSIN